ncbi:MAG: winged helix-turn-helix domain-containing protein [Actinomycetota bacterium]
MSHRILLIEDEDGIGEPLQYQLSRSGYAVDWERDGTGAVQRFHATTPDLVVLDLMLPGLSGEDICREIRRTSDTPIIILTAKDTEIDKVVGLELGADDYMTKPFSTRELIARVKAVMRRTGSAVPEEHRILEGGGIQLKPDALEVSVRGQTIHLARKEFELLELLMENAGRVVTREMLIDRVWGSGYFGDMRTLDVHIKRLRSKCEADPRHPKHIVTARGWGYKFVP